MNLYSKAKNFLGSKRDGNRSTIWESLLVSQREEWVSARRSAQTGLNILIATSIGGHAAVTTLESMLAVALTLRRVRVHLLLCDEFLPACLQAQIGKLSDAELAVHGPARQLRAS